MTGAFPTRVRVHPGRLAGVVEVPGDKSISHRALIIGAIASGRTEVSGIARSGDVAATAEALRRMGADLRLEEDASGRLAGAVSGPLREADDVIDCGNSGTALRLLAGVAATIEGLTVLTGDASLVTRPVDRVTAPLTLMGATCDARAQGRLPPLTVRGGSLRGIDYASPVSSAQVKSAVLLAGLRASGPTSVTSPLRSRDHTERLLGHLGVAVERVEEQDGTEVVTITPGEPGARPVTVPRDPSSAAFWVIAAAPQHGSEITLPGLCVNPTRLGFSSVLRDMGADVTVSEEGEASGEPVGTVTVRGGDLVRAVVAGSRTVDTIDELPILAVAGALSREGLEVRDAAELRVKESDRIRAVSELLGTLGATVEERADGFLVPGGQRLSGGLVRAHGDHRIAMAAAVAGTLAEAPVEIEGFAAVASSYPSFLDDLRRLGGKVET